MTAPVPLELLSPARDAATAREAILHGADAVYIGSEGFGARSRAGNSVADIAALVRFAAPFGVKVYVTVNTIIYESEIPEVESLIRRLYAAGVDALIIQDLGILQMNIPPIALHASTQCDTRTPEKARFLADLGMSQIVIARETSLEETRKICQAVPGTPVEAFVHGALCVSYSGDCRASLLATGRSANRGECAQMCRLRYTLTDGKGRQTGHPSYFLSLRDLRRIDNLAAMADAGVRSFKIEGRLKDAAYVKNVTAAYRRALDALIEARPDRYCRASRGESSLTFTPDLGQSFNRGYTDYFLTSPANPGSMATFDTPKAAGERVGIVTASDGTCIRARFSLPLNNGDGLTYLTPENRTGGFRANRIEGNRIFTPTPLQLPAGTILMRNHNRLWEELMEKKTAERRIKVSLTLRAYHEERIALDGYIEGVGTVTVTTPAEMSEASTPDNGYRLKTLSKTGDTIFKIDSLDDRLEGLFIRASVLTALRRDLCAAMLDTLQCRHIPERRRQASKAQIPEGHALTFADNISNSLAEATWRQAGAVGTIAGAAEIAMPRPSTEFRVMTTRYCLRRELGACLRHGGAATLPGPLTLRNDGNDEYRLDFDCAACRMNVIALPRKQKSNKTTYNVKS